MAIPTYVKPMLIPALIGVFLILSVFVFMDFYSDPVSSSAQPDNRICQTTSVTETATTEFKFRCGSVSDMEKLESIKLDVSALKKEQLCSVYLDQDGQIKLMECKAKPESLDYFIATGAQLTGDWSCSGLSSDSSKINELHIADNGVFELAIPAVVNSEFVWSVSNSVVSGQFERGNHKVIFTPKAWSSAVIAAAGLSIDQAPPYAIYARPFTVEITNLTSSRLRGSVSFDQSLRSQTDTILDCRRGSAEKIAASN